MKMHSMCCCVQHVKSKHNAAHVNKDRPDLMVNQALKEKTVPQALLTDHPAHQVPMLKFAIDFCQFHHSAHVQRRPARPVNPVHPETTVLPETKDRTEMTVHPARWDSPVHQVPLARQETQAREDHPENRAFSLQVPVHHRDHPVNLVVQAHPDHQDSLEHPAKTATTVVPVRMDSPVNVDLPDKMVQPDHRASKDKQVHQDLAIIAHRHVWHPDINYNNKNIVLSSVVISTIEANKLVRAVLLLVLGQCRMSRQ